MNEPGDYSIGELSEKSKVQPRTIHFYIKEGLLSPPSSKGGGARYTERHLVLLKLIDHLKCTNLRLAEIRQKLAGSSDDALQELLRQAESGELVFTTSRPGPPLAHRLDVRERDVSYAALTDHDLHEDSLRQPDLPLFERRRTRPERERWYRISICDGCEVNMRDDLHPHLRKKLTRLIEEFQLSLPPPPV